MIPRILVVDDFSTMRRILRNLLKELGFHEVDEAEDGAMALQKLMTTRYGLVISDWHMPPPDGLELLQILRSTPEWQRLPVLMVTAESERDNIIAAAQSGASAYIIKPFTAATLGEKVQKILSEAP